MSDFSVRDAFEGREVLITGVTGFLAKVWVVMMLDRVPGISKVHLLVRAKQGQDPLQRFENMVNESPAFGPLHDRYGERLGEFLREKVVVHDGDLAKPMFGLSPETFGGSLSLVVNSAAVVNFQPDVREALRTNVHGSLNAAELADACGARLLSVSTCFVAGLRDGRIEETRHVQTPKGNPFDPELACSALQQAIDELEEHHASEDFAHALREKAIERLQAREKETSEAAIERQIERLRKRRIESDFKDLGTDRARERGWPNTYTYTKAISEQLVAARFAALPKSIFRPAVIESARSFPMPGWNEGFNTCGPLAYLIGTWFKALPGRKDNSFDVVPVDMICEGLAVAGAALLRDEHAEVYQCGTSARNRLTIGRANELTGLSQRRHMRAEGESALERVIKSRADTTLFDGRHPLSLQGVDTGMSWAARLLRGLPGATPPGIRSKARKQAKAIESGRRTLRQVEVIVDAFTPFTRDMRQVFVADNLSKHQAEADFAWNPETIDWRSYWFDVHMPGMRLWSFPLLDGGDLPTLEPAHPVELARCSEAAE